MTMKNAGNILTTGGARATVLVHQICAFLAIPSMGCRATRGIGMQESCSSGSLKADTTQQRFQRFYRSATVVD